MELLLDEFGQWARVDVQAEFDVVVLGAETEVGAGDDEELMVDGHELGVVADEGALDFARAVDGRAGKLCRDFNARGGAWPLRLVGGAGVQIDADTDGAAGGDLSEGAPQGGRLLEVERRTGHRLAGR